MIRCPRCGDPLPPDFEHVCRRVTITGPSPVRQEFPWTFWGPLILLAFAIAWLASQVVSFLDRCD